MPSDLQVSNIRDLTNANSAISIASDGQVTIAQNNPTIQLGSNVTFPAGHVIQTFTDTYVAPSVITVTTTSNDYLGSNLQVTITPKATGNKLFIQAFIHGVYNLATNGRSLHSGFAYDANFSSGNGTTIGPRAVVADYHGFISQDYTLLTNLQYSSIVTVGTNAPSAGSESIIRPIFKSTTGDTQIAANTQGGAVGVFSMMVMEIQA